MALALRGQYLDLLKAEANYQKLDYNILDAIITVESGWNPWAVRFEPNFPYISDIDKFSSFNHITAGTERQLQRFSYGLGQLMGGTARDLGFTGTLVTLLEPEINLHWVCTFFKKRCDKYLELTDKFAVYNAGSVKRQLGGTYVNQGYVDKCLKAYLEITK